MFESVSSPYQREDRVARRIRAWINCSTSGSGVVEKKGVEVGRGERGRKGERGRTRAIETGDR